jgi:hypothetical protein
LFSPRELLSLWRKREEKFFFARHLTLPAEGWLDPTVKPPREKAQTTCRLNDTQKETFVKPIIAPPKEFLLNLV